jgi:hypothetical protein
MLSESLKQSTSGTERRGEGIPTDVGSVDQGTGSWKQLCGSSAYRTSKMSTAGVGEGQALLSKQHEHSLKQKEEDIPAGAGCTLAPLTM